MKTARFTGLVALLVSVTCTAEVVTLNGADGYELTADYYEGAEGGAGVILLHQCNGERSMYGEVASLMAEQGLHVLAMDLRGYGDSISGDVDVMKIRAATADFAEYRKASAHISEHWASDILIAADFLRDQIGDAAVLGAGGASCGGSQSVALAEQREISAIMTFSSGLNEEMLERYKALEPVPTLIIAAEDDGATHERALAQFAAANDPATTLLSYKGEGHGSPLFEQDPHLAGTIADWYAAQLASSE